jgi:hypothetical protein
MNRRRLLIALLGGAAAVRPQEAPRSVRGRLEQRDGRPALLVDGGRTVTPTGDAQTEGVLRDSRLSGADFELIGRYTAPAVFAVDPIHTRALFVHKDGKRLYVTYWCEVCAIRTYSPGVCWCCQEETALDLRESL